MNSENLNQSRRGLIPEDLLKFRWAVDLTLDPTGTFAAYTVKQPSAEINGYVTHLYVRKLDEAMPRKVTTGSGQASSPAWSRDGAKLAFAWSEDGVNTLCVLNAIHAPDQIRRFPLPGAGMSGLDWSADSTKIVGVRWTPMRHPEDQGPRPGIPAPTIRVIRRLRYKMDGAGWVHDRYTQIWVLEVATGDLVQVTNSEIDFSEPKWSGSGERIAFVGLAREQNTELGQGQIFVCDYPDGGAQLLIPGWQGAMRSPAWGDGDRFIAFAGHNQPTPVNRRIFMTPFVADVTARTARPLDPDLKEEVGNYAVADQRAGLANITVRWPHGDRWIYYLLTEQGGVNLYRIDVDGTTERLVEGDNVAFEYSPIAGDRVLYGLADPASPGDLYVWQGGKSTKLTALNPWLRDHTLSTPESYWYDGVDGAKVHAWVLKPPNFDPTQRYPTIVYVHCSMFSWDFNHEFQCLAAAGFVVAYFNQRGTTAGYGQDWTRASEGDQGGKDYEEIMLGVDELISRPYVDGDRLGVTGGSCGGFMTNWIVGHTDRFKAAVTQRSIVNQISMFGTSDIGPECTLGETSDTPWSSLEAVWRQSPIAYAEQIHTPLLIVHSTEDHRCPLEQAEQLFAALRWLGREVELVIFEGENHGLSRGGRPGNRIERLRRIGGWFEKHL
ncbi:prolyl oligopeptidase family serine peptidase [bacterium]|nr:prolyl oligopeptidase family serine peptidase [bacterium]